MKMWRLIVIVSMGLMVALIVLICGTKSPARPSLILLGYSPSPTNGPSHADLLLANTTRETIWVFRHGETGGDLQPEYLEYHRPVWDTPAKSTNSYAMVNSVKIGNFALRGDKLAPEAVLPLKVPIMSGAPPKYVGITYYHGSFRDSHEFVESLMIPIHQNEQGILEKIRTAAQKFIQKIRSKRATPHEVWCPQELWLSAGNTAAVSSTAKILPTK